MRPIIINDVLHPAQILGDTYTALREAAMASGFISATDFDKAAVPANMVGNPRADLGL